MQLLSPRHWEFVRHFVDAATTRSLLVDLERLRRVTPVSNRPETDTLESSQQRDAA